MKHIYSLLLGLLCYAPIFAQIPNCTIPKPINEEIAEILQPLDKSQIPTGTLYEAVYPWANVTKFDGTSNTDTSNTLHFVQAYNEIYNSSYSRGGMIHPADFERKLIDFNADPEFHHPIGIIDYNINTIKPSAVNDNLLFVNNNKLYDVSGRSQSPYETQNVFMSVPLFAEGFDNLTSGATHYFYLDTDFIISNNGFDFADYDYMDFELDGQLLHREYFSSATSNNKVLFPFFRIIPVFFPRISQLAKIAILTVIIKKKVFGTKISRIELKEDDIIDLTPCSGLTQIFVTGDTFDAGYGQGSYGAMGRGYMYFADTTNCPSQQIRRPVIFVDGFDPTNTRKVGSIWNDRINRKFKENGVDKYFGKELRDNGYDVIIYDYDEKGTNRGGAGFIENNGLAFAKFLETLYNQYQGSIEQDFVIIAPSMGAMVVRYALAYMEKNNKPHHTRTYISFDGPQQGAEVPLGVQQMLDMATQYGGLRILESVRNFLHQSNAAKQMLVNHSSNGSETIEPHPYRLHFLSNLNAVNQYPSQCRKVAIVNGNRSGIKKSQYQPDNDVLNACEEEFEMAIVKTTNPVCTSDCDVVRMKLYTQSENSRCESLNFAVNNKTNLFKLIFGGGQFSQKVFYTQPFNGQSYDIAPGGNFGADAEVNLEDDPAKKFTEIFQKVASKSITLPLNKLPYTNFMPTVSSVDYAFPNGENYNLYKNFTSVNLSKCAGTTPFDTVYAPLDKDLGHARNDERLINAFRYEIYHQLGSTCAGNCQDYLTLNSTIRSNSSDIYRANKAIILQPNFQANSNSSLVFCATIGCPQFQVYEQKNTGNTNISSTCLPNSFTWDTPSIQCLGNGYTIFTAMVKNIDINTYSEFSIDGVNYYKANLFDRGYQITLPNQSNAQIFFARSADNRNNVIGGYIGYCNN